MKGRTKSIFSLYLFVDTDLYGEIERIIFITEIWKYNLLHVNELTDQLPWLRKDMIKFIIPNIQRVMDKPLYNLHKNENKTDM